MLAQLYKISSPATRREHKPPSQRNERSRGGRTAKATVALGTLPFFSLMPRSTSRSLFFDQSDIGSFSAVWNGKCIQEFAFSFCDRPECARAEGGCQAADSSSIRGGVYAGNEVGYRQSEFRRDVRHSKLRVSGVRRKHGQSRQRVQVPGRVSDGLTSALGADRFSRVNQPTPKATSRVDLNGWAPS